MKKISLISSVIILTILLSPVAHAEVSSTTANKINDLKQKISDTKQSVLETKDSVETRIGKKLDEKKLKVANVFEIAIQNLKDLISRIESRIAKMKLNGLDTLASEKLLETANSKLILSETELATLENMLVTDIPTSTSTKNVERRAALQKIKVQSEKTKTSIKAAHQSIILVVESLKAGLLKEKKATSTNN